MELVWYPHLQCCQQPEIATGIAILLHEIPQEVRDFATLIHSRFPKKKAIYFNVGVSLLTFVGILVGQFLLSTNPEMKKYLIMFAAGSIIYLALSNLIPEVHTFHKKGVSWPSILFFVLGMVII